MYFIPVPFPFHSCSIPISFPFHFRCIPISFPLHSHFIPAPFPFHSTLNRFSDLSSFFTGFFRKVQSVCLSLTWRAEEKKHHTSDLKVGLLFRSYFGQLGKSGIFLELLSQKLRENLCRLRQQVFITLGQLPWKLWSNTKTKYTTGKSNGSPGSCMKVETEKCKKSNLWSGYGDLDNYFPVLLGQGPSDLGHKAGVSWFDWAYDMDQFSDLVDLWVMKVKKAYDPLRT